MVYLTTKKRPHLDRQSTRRLSRSYDEQQEEEIIDDDDDDFGSYEEQGVTMEIPNEIPDRPWRLRADSF